MKRDPIGRMGKKNARSRALSKKQMSTTHGNVLNGYELEVSFRISCAIFGCPHSFYCALSIAGQIVLSWNLLTSYCDWSVAIIVAYKGWLILDLVNAFVRHVIRNSDHPRSLTGQRGVGKEREEQSGVD